MSAPCPAWCQLKDDPAAHDVHTLVVFDGPPTATLLMTDEAGAFPEGVIRFRYYVDGRHRWVEARATIAADLANVFDSLKLQDVGDFAAALIRAYGLLAVQEWAVVPDPPSPSS